jgi:hypothetical protein
MSELLPLTVPGGGLAVAAAGLGLAASVLVLIVHRRQRAAIARLEERLTHLTAGVSMLTNTTEEGLRGVALEIARLTRVADARPAAVTNTRERIASAAVQGRSVQDIASTEQVSEGEVLLHLLLEKLKPEATHA